MRWANQKRAFPGAAVIGSAGFLRVRRIPDIMPKLHATLACKDRILNSQQGGEMLKEFRDFINRGNVVDLAIAVIIGGAFGAIVTSLVNDIIMPLIGVILGGFDFASLSIQIGEAAIMYGSFIQAIVNFLLIAFVLFLIVRSLNKLQKEQEAAPPPPPQPSAEEKLLAEIRDLLKERN
jgi:large conductance mechanosensitive channel